MAALRELLAESPDIEKAVIIDDLFGRLRAVLWGDNQALLALQERVNERLEAVAAPYWTGDIWLAPGANPADRALYNRAWQEARPLPGFPRLRVADRRRNRGAWFQAMRRPPWAAPKGPPVVVFYSWKGGVGRSTALASFAIQRSRAGERVAVLDLDLDAPGVGSLLAADAAGTTADWGVVDYLLEQPQAEVDLRDYYHACRQSWSPRSIRANTPCWHC